VTDGNGLSDSALVTVFVGVPVAQNESVSTPENNAVTITLSATQTGNVTMTFAIDADPTHGTLGAIGSVTNTFNSTTNTTTSTADVVYTPGSDYSGPDSFLYSATDNHNQTSSDATVSITVNEVALNAITDSNGAANTVSEGAANGDTVGITAHSTDPGGETVAYSLTNDAGGSFTIDSSSGVVTVADSSKLVDLGATASITVKAAEADDGGGAVTQDFTINVTEVALNTITDANSADNTVTETAANGTAVGITASSSDPAGETAAYSLEHDGGGPFTIDSRSGLGVLACSS